MLILHFNLLNHTGLFEFFLFDQINLLFLSFNRLKCGVLQQLTSDLLVNLIQIEKVLIEHNFEFLAMLESLFL